MRVAQGDLPGALAAFDESLTIARGLAARDPGNAGWTRDLGQLAVGDARTGRAFDESLTIRRDLAARDPGNAGWARDLGQPDKLGDVRTRRPARRLATTSPDAATSPPATRATPAGPATSRSA